MFLRFVARCKLFSGRWLASVLLLLAFKLCSFKQWDISLNRCIVLRLILRFLEPLSLLPVHQLPTNLRLSPLRTVT